MDEVGECFFHEKYIYLGWLRDGNLGEGNYIVFNEYVGKADLRERHTASKAESSLCELNHLIKLSFTYCLQLLFLIMSILFILCLFWLHLCNHVKFFAFRTNLNLYSARRNYCSNLHLCWSFFSVNLSILFICESEIDQIFLLLNYVNPNFMFLLKLAFNVRTRYRLHFLLRLQYSCFIFRLHQLNSYFV